MGSGLGEGGRYGGGGHRRVRSTAEIMSFIAPLYHGKPERRGVCFHRNILEMLRWIGCVEDVIQR